MIKLIIFGAGFSGKAISKRLKSGGHSIAGTTRSAEKFDQLKTCGIEPFHFDGGKLSDNLRKFMGEATHLIQSISPDKVGDPLIPLLSGALLDVMPKLKWVGYLSTVGVYGNHDGTWVDEETICRPVSVRSIARLEAEAQWQNLCESHNLPLSILRLSGIYGIGRNTFVNFDKGTARRLIKKDQVFNRIFVDDIAGATELLIDKNANGIFNVTDDEPAPPQDVVTYAAHKLGVNPPPEIDFETAELSPMARSFYGENKRVSNAKIKQLGFKFTYPNYRVALDYLYDQRIQSEA